MESVTKSDIEKGCLESYERTLTQTKGTPMTISPLIDDFGLLGTGSAADELLRGTYNFPEGIDKSVKSVLDNMKCPETIKLTKQPIPITCNEHKSGWNKVKERTSSSPSGLHVGHWKCASADENLNWLNTSMANIPFLSGYSPRRWQNGINVMLEKKKGNFRVDKLRTILLFEADFNLNNKYIGRNMMSTAEKAKSTVITPRVITKTVITC